MRKIIVMLALMGAVGFGIVGCGEETTPTVPEKKDDVKVPDVPDAPKVPDAPE